MCCSYYFSTRGVFQHDLVRRGAATDGGCGVAQPLEASAEIGFGGFLGRASWRGYSVASQRNRRFVGVAARARCRGSVSAASGVSDLLIFGSQDWRAVRLLDCAFADCRKCWCRSCGLDGGVCRVARRLDRSRYGRDALGPGLPRHWAVHAHPGEPAAELLVRRPVSSMLGRPYPARERVDVLFVALRRAVAEPDCYGPFRLVGAGLLVHLDCVDLEDLRAVEILRQRGRQVLHDAVSGPLPLGTLRLDLQPAHGGPAVDAVVAWRVRGRILCPGPRRSVRVGCSCLASARVCAVRLSGVATNGSV